MARILYTNIAELITNRGVARKGGVFVTEADLGIIRNGALPQSLYMIVLIRVSKFRMCSLPMNVGIR